MCRHLIFLQVVVQVVVAERLHSYASFTGKCSLCPSDSDDSNPDTLCVCSCSDDFPSLAFDETKALLTVGGSNNTNQSSWEELCNDLLARDDLRKDLQLIVGWKAAQMAAGVADPFKFVIAGEIAGRLSLIPHLFGFLHKHALLGKTVTNGITCVKQLTKLSNVLKLAFGGPCADFRRAVTTFVKTAFGFTWYAFRKGTIRSTMTNFNLAFKAFGKQQDPLRGVLHFMNGLFQLQPAGKWQLRIVDSLSGMMKLGGVVFPAMQAAQAGKAVMRFLMETSQQIDMRERLATATVRQQAADACLNELPEKATPAMKVGCRVLLHGSLGVKGECGARLVDSHSATGCAIYGAVTEAPPGVLVESLGFGLFRQGMRACDVIQQIEWKEGGTMDFMPKWLQKKMDVHEKTHVLNVTSAKALADFFDSQKSEVRRTQDEFAAARTSHLGLNWRVVVKGMALDLEALPETKWKPFIEEDFLFDILDCGAEDRFDILERDQNEDEDADADEDADEFYESN
eukprot:TRINITY_DN2420_c0_g2_i2.p1 TRINITY_DN2420_c0_g2~~TRINITY_DN2420_c0_g2_i2.p1  ORF type:complete len:512 (+),score=91.60 TRINITY_DN2420_c0_g2_i2:129-1664(+)